MRILLDIDGTIATWESVREHGFGPETRPFDQRVLRLIREHDVTLFSQNPEITRWAEQLGCSYIQKPPPGSMLLRLSGYDVLVDDDADLFAEHCEGIAVHLSLDEFLREHPLTGK